MRRRIRRHPDVANDIVEIASYIAQHNKTAALRFFDSVEAALKWLLRHPGAAALRDFEDPALSRIRAWAPRKFPSHLIFYEVEDTGIYVLAILHGARDLAPVLRRRSR